MPRGVETGRKLGRSGVADCRYHALFFPRAAAFATARLNWGLPLPFLIVSLSACLPGESLHHHVAARYRVAGTRCCRGARSFRAEYSGFTAAFVALSSVVLFCAFPPLRRGAD